MCNMLSIEVFLLALPENEYSQVKSLRLSCKIWKALESIFEGDKHAKRTRLKNWICLFQEAKMMEDESVRNYICRISKIIAGFKVCEDTNEEDEII